MSEKSKAVKYIGLVVGVFAITGIGLGTTGFMSLSATRSIFINPNQGEFARSLGEMFVGLLFIQSIIITLFIGPVISAVSGLFTGISLKHRRDAILAGGAGSFIGFYIMIFLAVFIMAMGFSSGSGSSGGGSGQFEATQFLGTAAKAAIPATISGAVGGYLGTSFIDVDLTVSVGSDVHTTQSSD